MIKGQVVNSVWFTICLMMCGIVDDMWLILWYHMVMQLVDRSMIMKMYSLTSLVGWHAEMAKRLRWKQLTSLVYVSQWMIFISISASINSEYPPTMQLMPSQKSPVFVGCCSPAPRVTCFRTDFGGSFAFESSQGQLMT